MEEQARSQEWRKQFDERDQKEITFAEVYLRGFQHGTPGHLHLMLIAKLAYALDLAEAQILGDPDAITEAELQEGIEEMRKAGLVK